MSIYTVVKQSQLETYLHQYDIGTLLNFAGIEAGVENTNYFVTTTRGEYVLTLVESADAERVAFVLNLVTRLAASGVAVAEPIPCRSGALSSSLNGRPSVLMHRLQGRPPAQPNRAQCAAIGNTLAQAHRATSELPQDAYCHIHQWCSEQGARVMAHLSDADRHRLQEALLDAGTLPWTSLPQGPIHADLFPDNALFDGDKLSGLIDFYHACTAPYLYDLAVTLNAWCYDEGTDRYDSDRAAALLDAYQAVRPLSDEEQRWLLPMQRAAALRFWLSRLVDYFFARTGEQVTTRNPGGKRNLLDLLRSTASTSL